MKILKYVLACTCLCAANSFAEPMPVPAAKAAYIGTWQGKDMDLKIAADGKIAYQRITGKNHVKLSIELASFNGDSFNAGVGIFNSTFNVSQPPRKFGDKTKMVVDGVELTKLD